MADPRQMSFWSAEERALYEELAPLIIKMYLKGATNGMETLPVNLQVLVNWDYFNEGVVDFLRTYRLHTLTGITETTRKATVKAIDEWIQSGEPLPNLIAKLEPLFGIARAERIAVTEVTRVFAEGNRAAWRSTGLVGGMRWNTVNDDLVCPICGPLDGMIVELDGNGFTTSDGEGITGPPAHVSCRCFLTPVVSVEKLEDRLDEILR